MCQLRAARRENVTNKTLEREREPRGEVLSATRYSSRLACWAPEVRKSYLLARRSVGLVGYVGHVKRKLGYKTPSEQDHMDNATRECLDDLAENLRRINQNRRNWGTWRQRSEKDRDGRKSPFLEGLGRCFCVVRLDYVRVQVIVCIWMSTLFRS
jgi:hypothetical protein